MDVYLLAARCWAIELQNEVSTLIYGSYEESIQFNSRAIKYAWPRVDGKLGRLFAAQAAWSFNTNMYPVLALLEMPPIRTCMVMRTFLEKQVVLAKDTDCK